jgi:hypothetical protein
MTFASEDQVIAPGVGMLGGNPSRTTYFLAYEELNIEKPTSVTTSLAAQNTLECFGRRAAARNRLECSVWPGGAGWNQDLEGSSGDGAIAQLAAESMPR